MLYGNFKTLNNEIISVEFDKANTSSIQIGANNSSLVYFSDDPVTISQEDEGLEEPVIIKKCTVRLFTSIDIYDQIFAVNPWDVKVTVTNTTTNNKLFSGYAVPLSFNQDYSEKWNLIDIECVDILGTLENKPYIDKNWGTAIQKATIRSFRDIICNRVFNFSGILPSDPIVHVLADNSYIDDLVENLDNKCNELVLLGETEDEHKSCLDALKIVLTYLGLNITSSINNLNGVYIYDKANFYVEDNENDWKIYNLNTNTKVTYNRDCVDWVSSSNTGYIDKQYDISIIEPVTQMKIEVERKETKEVVPDLFKDNITSKYASREKFLVEYGVNSTIYNNFIDLISNRQNGTISTDDGWTRNWWIHVLINEGWKIYDRNGTEQTERQGGTQTQWLNKLERGIQVYTPVLMDVIREDKRTKENAYNALGWNENRILLLPINGNNDDSENGHLPKWSNLQTTTTGCMIKYENVNQVNYTPVDDGVTNYMIFNGSIAYAPLERTSYIPNGNSRTNEYSTMFRDIVNGCTEDTFGHMEFERTSWNTSENVIVQRPTIMNGFIKMPDGHGYYAQSFYANNIENPNSRYFVPMVDNADNIEKMFDYDGGCVTLINNVEKTINKVPMLLCSLQIGDKYLNESFDANGNSVFTWTTTPSTFTIGITPKNDEAILGTFYDLNNNVEVNTGIKTKGMAIPIRKSDNLIGELTFKIICALEPQYDSETDRTFVLFGNNDEQRQNYDRYILSHVSSICLKSFKIELEAGGNEDKVNSVDLCYMSDVSNNYIKNETSISFDLCSALTSQEAAELNVDNGIFVNSVYDENDEQCTAINEYGGTTSKAEEAYIHKWYDVMKNVRKEYRITLKDEASNSTNRNLCNILMTPHFTIYNGNEQYTEKKLDVLNAVEFNVKTNDITFTGECIN